MKDAASVLHRIRLHQRRHLINGIADASQEALVTAQHAQQAAEEQLKQVKKAQSASGASSASATAAEAAVAQAHARLAAVQESSTQSLRSAVMRILLKKRMGRDQDIIANQLMLG